MSPQILSWDIKDTAYWKKSQAKEEFLEHIMDSADCIGENNKIIRKAINFLRQKKLCIQKSRYHSEQ